VKFLKIFKFWGQLNFKFGKKKSITSFPGNAILLEKMALNQNRFFAKLGFSEVF
jgi:hypothetical protein